MHDLLTVEEDLRARALGWELVWVYDTTKWIVRAVPLVFTKTTPHASWMTDFLAVTAKQGDALSLRALRLMANPPPLKGKKK